MPAQGAGGRRGYNPAVSRYYSLSDADAMVPDLAPVVDRLRLLRKEIVTLRDAYRLREGVLLAELITGTDGPSPSTGADDEARLDADPELARLRLRMRGLVDQMQADAAWLDDREIVLRDISTGLLDFPALASGRPIWLCWRLGEPSIAAWHPHDEGFSGRRPIAELVGPEARA
jgi:hypothetical protein